jgi:hypothetical protein
MWNGLWTVGIKPGMNVDRRAKLMGLTIIG